MIYKSKDIKVSIKHLQALCEPATKYKTLCTHKCVKLITYTHLILSKL